MYRSYKTAETDVGEMMLFVQTLWFRTEIQLDFLRAIWDTLSESHQLLQNRLLHVLQTKLHDAVIIFEGIVGKGGKLKKLKFAISVKDYLAQTIEELNKWQDIFDPSYFLVGRISASLIDRNLRTAPAETVEKGSLSQMKELREALPPPSSLKQLGSGEVDQLRQAIGASTGHRMTSVFITDAAVSPNTCSIAHSSSRLGTLEQSRHIVILDSVRPHSEDEAVGIMKGVRELAQVLRTVDPIRFGLLVCCGVIKVLKEDTGTRIDPRPKERVAHFDFVFAVPQSLTKPRSLRDILLTSNPSVSLNELLTLAKSLARSIFFVHTSRFVHKNIRPENILVFEDTKHIVGRPYLVGYERFRADGSQSMKFGDGLWERDLYRHPTRQGLQPEQYFVMQHDIYSLGVVLLEIGLRTSFVIPFDGDTSPNPNPCLEISDFLSSRDAPGRAKLLKKRLITLATDQLPAMMGQRYAEVVLSCLTCLDTDNERFGDQDELEDEDGIEVGVRYIEKVRLLHSNSKSATLLSLSDTHTPGRDTALTSVIVIASSKLIVISDAK
ncbi:hypothetical protein MMC12_005151 [Toensbergia leucococca]|nr:hypothetical protein [Toensbergia leucococca]